MRVLMFGPDPTTKGGIATVIANFKNHFKTVANDIFYLESWKEGHLSKRILSSAKGIVTLPFQILTKKIDLVHIHIAQDGSYFRKAIAVRLTKLCRKKVLLHVHGSHFDMYHQESKPWLQRHLIRTLQKADKIIVLNEDVQAYFREYQIATEIIFNAVPVPKQQKKASERSQISCFGQLGKRKGTYDILKVAEVLKRKYPSITIVLYGDGDTVEVSRIIQDNKLTNVKLGGWVSAEEKELAMQETLIHILPSYQEGLPMAILETMAHGISNIGTYVGGIPSVIEPGVNGMLIQPGNTTELEQALTLLLEQELLREQMGIAAYEKISHEFSMPVYLRRWEKIYSRLE
ncbi:glycosyltransferase family 4 protein [Listeria booriae]|uniref:glycosyltransferase family 4 protein n=1 Tax=Listeria booriae TaxID=1552123 RepID=UPI00162A1FDC|nr:glycosyltransferase family 4 protein [Listeria booriae]MBC1358842.1 glycosyltransferase family 4 protein [Listeria booriae]